MVESQSGRVGVERVTFLPSLINLNDLINQLYVCKPPALALSNEFRVASLV